MCPESLDEALDPEGAVDALAVLSAQVTYRLALLDSPDRATPAMVLEIKSHIAEKHLGNRVRYVDIPHLRQHFQ